MRGIAMNTVIDIWDEVEPPPAPKLRPVDLDPKNSALLVLDIQDGNCNSERRPRCVDKFYGTELAEILQEAGVETVVLVGTAAEGAILNTATGAALRGYNVND